MSETLHPLHVRVTMAELAIVRERAQKAGHATTASYVRMLLGLPVLWRGRPLKNGAESETSQESTAKPEKAVARRSRAG